MTIFETHQDMLDAYKHFDRKIMKDTIDACIDRYGRNIISAWCGPSLHDDLGKLLEIPKNMINCFGGYRQYQHFSFQYRGVIFRVGGGAIHHDSMLFLLRDSEPIEIYIWCPRNPVTKNWDTEFILCRKGGIREEDEKLPIKPITMISKELD